MIRTLGAAVFALGLAILSFGEELKPPAAVAALRQKAEHGDAQAQYELGLLYEHGTGVTKEMAEAIRWYRKAEKLGSADARHTLELISFLLRSDAESVAWYRKAAEQGDARAQAALGTLYAQGSGLPKDYAEALRWLRKAADQGDMIARQRLGILYFTGTGVERDFAEGARWYGCPKPAEEVLASCRKTTLDELPEGASALWQKMGCDASGSYSEGSLVRLREDGPPVYRVCCHDSPHGPGNAMLIGEVAGQWRDLTPGTGAGWEFYDACASFVVLERRHAGFHDLCLPDECAKGTGSSGKPCTPLILEFDGAVYRERAR